MTDSRPIMLATHGQPVRCRAHNSRGEACGHYPMRGAVVCRVHGGSAPQVKKAAAERIAEMVDPALTELLRIVESGDSDAIRLAAIKDVLDRAGYKPKERVESVSVNAFTLRIDRGDSDA